MTRTMMQRCASAAKLRGGGPILKDGIKAMAACGTPPPRTVIGDPSRCRDRAETINVLEPTLPSVCRTQNDALGHDAIARESPQGDQQLASQGDDHLLARAAGVPGARSKPLCPDAPSLELQKARP